MTSSERAGQPADPAELVDVTELLAAYERRRPDAHDPAQRVAFGTSGHRGSSLRTSFNEAHIVATTAAICAHRRGEGSNGPLFMARDTHALSEPAFQTALEVLVADGVDVRIDAADGYTPTPALSHAILTWNRQHPQAPADGIVVTPSHNPPADGGFKYNPPSGGPADATTTRTIENAANDLLEDGWQRVARTRGEQARAAAQGYDFMGRYVDDLPDVVDMAAIAASGLHIGVDPLGGAAVAYWGAIAERHGLDLVVTNDRVDPTFGFMTLDWDGQIRMDPSSPHAMARLIALRGDYDLALGNDADADRFGVVTPDLGLLQPNHFLAAAAWYLFGGAREWRRDAAIGKTLVSSSLQDRIAAALGRRLYEVPVGFKWFVDGMLDGSVAFGGEESAGLSFLCRDGRPWSTDKDGLIACLLAAELTASTGHDPGHLYHELTDRFGAPRYRRVDAPATPAQKAALGRLSATDVRATELAGDAVLAKLTEAPGNGAPIGGLKVVSERGWFAARPSGTEDVAKLYAESFVDEDHLARIIEEAQHIVTAATGHGHEVAVSWVRHAKIAFIGSHGIRKTTAALAFASVIQSAGRSVEFAREVVRDNPLEINESATGEAQLWVLMSQVRRELELAQKADCVVTDRGVMDNFAYYLRACGGRDEFDVEPLVRRWSRTYDLVVRLTPDVQIRADGVRSTSDRFRDEVEAILDARLPRLVTRSRLIVQPASQVTETHDWWPLAEKLATLVGEPLLAPGVSRPTRQARSGTARARAARPTPQDQLPLDLGH